MHKRGSHLLLLQQQMLDFGPEWDLRRRRENLPAWRQHMDEVDGKQGTERMLLERAAGQCRGGKVERLRSDRDFPLTC
jgi:hypothetical protein